MEKIEAYFGRLSDEENAEYQRLKIIIKSEIPDIEEVMSYGLPTFKQQGKVILHFGVFKDHLSVFPGSKAIEQLADRLTAFTISKGTIQYSLDNLLPNKIIKEIIQINRMSEV